MSHAKSQKKARLKLHGEFASMLEENLGRRGASAAPAGEVFGKWQGPKNMTIDHEIVWPPMVIVMNTRLDHDENEKVLVLEDCYFANLCSDSCYCCSATVDWDGKPRAPRLFQLI